MTSSVVPYDKLQTDTGGDENVNQVKKLVEKAVADYDPQAEEKQELEFQGREVVDASVVFNRFSSTGDKLLFYNGLFWSFIFGAALPTFCFVFGELIDDIGGMATSKEENPMVTNSLYMVYVAVGVLFTAFFYISSLAVFSESISRNMKIEYFQAALAKDAAFYDEQNPNEMASKINKEAGALQKGTCEKIGSINYSVSGFILSYIVSFYWGWKFSLILTGALPFIAFSGIGWAMAM